MNTSYLNWGSDFKKDENDDEEEANSINGIEVKSIGKWFFLDT